MEGEETSFLRTWMTKNSFGLNPKDVSVVTSATFDEKLNSIVDRFASEPREWCDPIAVTLLKDSRSVTDHLILCVSVNNKTRRADLVGFLSMGKYKDVDTVHSMCGKTYEIKERLLRTLVEGGRLKAYGIPKVVAIVDKGDSFLFQKFGFKLENYSDSSMKATYIVPASGGRRKLRKTHSVRKNRYNRKRTHKSK
jgi:hypothetical protein